MTNLLRIARAAVFCAAALLFVDAGAAKAAVTDVAGHTFNVSSIRLKKGCKLKIVCGDSRLSVPLRAVQSMKIDPAQISSVDGRPHFGVEIKTRKGDVIGDIGERGRCLVCADNGFKGKSSKAAYGAPFSNVSGVQMLGKGDGGEAQTRGAEDEEEDE